jgi:hypothetical protein
MSVRTARNWTEGKVEDSVEVVWSREVEDISARTMRMQPSWANAVAVALPMPVFCRYGISGDGVERLTRGCTGD